MAKTLEPRGAAPIESSIPVGAIPLESILCTEELHRRPSRPPGHEEENRALVKLVSALADSPGTILQILAETILHITQCDSAGLSLLTRDGQTPDVCGERFYWPAIAGMWNPHVGGGTPRNFGPCGDVLDQNRTLLFKHFERRYPYLLPVVPAAEECLLVPFYAADKAVGTIWAIMHSDRRKFDAEDDRVMGSLGKFASSAYQILASIDELRVQIGEREKAEAALHELADGLEMQVRVRTQELEESRARIVTAGDEVRRRIERDLHDGAQQRLVSLVLQLRAAQAAAPPGADELAQRLEGVVTEVTSVLEELRETAHGLHPAILTEGGLRPALKALARRSAVPLRLDIQVAGQLLEPVEIAAYYAVSEALTNATKHGHASAAEVEVTADDGMLRVCVRDDGRGGAEFGKGSGLVGLKDRIEALGGRIWLQSPPGAGTAVQIALPLEDPGRAGSPDGAAER